MLSKEEIKILLDDGYEIVCESPLEFERYAQFAGGVHKLYTEIEQREEIVHIQISKDWKETQKRIIKERELEDLVTFIKKPVSDLLNIGITIETLIAFGEGYYNMKMRGNFKQDNVKVAIQETFNEES